MKPLLLSKQEWSRLQKWTKQGEEDPDVVQKREYIKFLDDRSKEMTKSWPNSLENVNKRNEEVRRMRHEAVEQANSKFYKRYVKRQRQEQEKLMYSARDTVFKNKDAPKLLLSAVIETATQKEREEQVKFQKQLRELEIENKRKEDEAIHRRSKEWHEMQARMASKRFEVNKEHQRAIVEQAKEEAEKQRKEYEDEIQRQKVDIVMAEREMEALKDFEEELKRKEKARILADIKQSKEDSDERRREQEARDKMDERLHEVLTRSNARIEKKRRETEQEIRDQKLHVIEALSAKLESGDAERDAKEQADLERAVKEKNAAADERHQSFLAKEAKNRKERQDTREQYLKDEAQRLHELDTFLRWNMMNNMKNQEIYEDYKEKVQEEKLRKIKEFREDILKQWKEREDRDAKELAETRDFYGAQAERKLREQDNKVLTHAAALLDEARKHGRPTLALHKAIDRYCKMYRLYGMPDLPDSLQAHFPKYATADRSRPDADYREPPPPRVDVAPDAIDDDDCDRNGLQDVAKVQKPMQESAKPQPPPAQSQDYKRRGPSNGLQQKDPGQTSNEAKLPKIKVLPCVATFPTFVECRPK